MATLQLSLQRGELFRPRHALCLRVLKGRVWLTRKGELEDRFLDPGDTRCLQPSDLPLIEALSPQVLVKLDEAPGPAGWRGRLHPGVLQG